MALSLVIIINIIIILSVSWFIDMNSPLFQSHVDQQTAEYFMW